jgi:dihydrofolate reductase
MTMTMTIEFDILGVCDLRGGLIKGDVSLLTDYFLDSVTNVKSIGKINVILMDISLWHEYPTMLGPWCALLVIDHNHENHAVRRDILTAACVPIVSSIDEGLSRLTNLRHVINKVFVMGDANLYRYALRHANVSKVRLAMIHDLNSAARSSFPLKYLTDWFVEEDAAYSGVLHNPLHKRTYSMHTWVRNDEEYERLGLFMPRILDVKKT